MGSLFGAPKTPKITPPEPAPSPLTVDEDLVNLQTRDRLRKRKGRASTILSSGTEEGQAHAKRALGT